MNRSRRELVPILCSVIAAGVLSWTYATPVDLRKDRSFEITDDPNSKVIEVHYSGGMIRAVLTYEVYGGGRILCIRDRWPPPNATPGVIVFEDRISKSELRDIVQDLTRSGVLELDWKAIRHHLDSRGSVSDSNTTFVILYLTRYRRRFAEPLHPLRFQVAQYALNFKIRRFPEIEELASLGRMLDRLEGIRRSWPQRP